MAIVKGRSRAGGGLFQYIMGSKGDNDEVELLEIRNCVSNNPKDAAWEMERIAELSRSKKPFYHGQLSLTKEESRNTTNKQYVDMVDRILKKLDCPENTKVLISKHTKQGANHIHYGFLRYDPSTGKNLSDSNNYYKHDDARKEIEEAYDLTRTPRRRLNKEQQREFVLGAWNDTKTGKEFIDTLKRQGIHVAASVKDRPYRMIDGERNLNLVRELEGVKTAEVRERLKDVKLRLDSEVMDELRKKPITKAKIVEARQEAEQVTLSERDKFLQEQEIERAKRKGPRL